MDTLDLADETDVSTFSHKIDLPTAPTFRPTSTEWLDPMKYIHAITPEASKFGIVKIIPPRNWQPPFSIDPDTFEFVPRKQPLRFLLAQTRQKAKWTEAYNIFCKSLGKDSAFPRYDTKKVDLHFLNTLMEKVMEKFKDEDKLEIDDWKKIATCLGLPPTEDAVQFIKEIINTHLKPFNSLSKVITQETAKSEDSCGLMKNIGSDRKGTKRKRGRPSKTPLPKKIIPSTFSNDNLFKGIILDGECTECQSVIKEGEIIGCIECFELFHEECVANKPSPKTAVPAWYCKGCVGSRVFQGTNFGFEDCNRPYDLEMFGEYADQFKMDYFRVSNPSIVPEKLVEEKFWKEVMSPDSPICVMYGADLHTLEHGSGFPTAATAKKGFLLDEQDANAKRYEKSAWNLTNLPKLPESVLRFIKQDVSGITVPWLYVGMLFSSFCWHNEDHWTFSINYLHFGETKTWYGIPGNQASDFEKRMKECAPSLFRNQPNLLHQLVTLLHPNQLTAANIDVFKINQNAGEFILTFPRAYHAGFNQGFNCAEAVNFATSSWLQEGYESILHYSEQNRKCVFSHEEMLCEMAKEAHKLNYPEALKAHIQLCTILAEETSFRQRMTEAKVPERKVLFEEYEDDDDRTCLHCNTTVFLSALTCQCIKEGMKLVCRQHYKQLCHCRLSKRELLYRYTIDEIQEFCTALIKRVMMFQYAKLPEEPKK